MQSTKNIIKKQETRVNKEFENLNNIKKILIGNFKYYIIKR
jgi:hypothetical protein